MASVNKAILIGNLGKDPETRTVGSTQVCKFSIATTESFKDKQGNKVDNTEWHNIEVWGELANIADKYLKKGSQVYLEGSIKTDSWEDNGVKKFATKIRCTNFTILGGTKEEGQKQDTNRQYSKPTEAKVPHGVVAEDTDCLPF